MRRQAAESELRAILETSPLAILTLDREGRVLQANHSAHRTFELPPGDLAGRQIDAFLPVSFLPVHQEQPAVHTRLECRAQRSSGEPFLAGIWSARYPAGGADHVAIVVWDGSEDLRDREEAGFDALMANSRILLGAVSHELRNFASAARTSYSRLELDPSAAASPDFARLGRALAGIEAVAGAGLRLTAPRPVSYVDLQTVLDDTAIIMEPALRGDGIQIQWDLPPVLPRVRGDQQGLIQVLINLLRNSQRALEKASPKLLQISATTSNHDVILRIRDSGPGVASPDDLFQPFHPGSETGLGLYVSRSIVRSFGGELRYEPSASGACFAILLRQGLSEEP